MHHARASAFGRVQVSTRSKTRPYQANVKRSGKNVYYTGLEPQPSRPPSQSATDTCGPPLGQVYLGNFATAEEAALCYARTPDAQAPLLHVHVLHTECVH